MNDIIKQDIIAVIHDSLQCAKDRNYVALKKLSNKTVHGASIFQEEDSVTVAVLIYSLSKIIERGDSVDVSGVVKYMETALDNLRKEDIVKYRASIKKALVLIASIDSKLKMYTEEVIRQAEIKKGSKLYDHGISLSKAAEMLGVTQWEMMDYIGKTKVADAFSEGSIKERYTFAKRLFGVKK